MAIVKTLFVAGDANGYAGWTDRVAMSLGITPGVLPTSRTGDVRSACQVTQKAVTPNFSVDVAAGWVLVDGTSLSNQGMYAGLNSASVNVPNAAGPPASLPRIDCLVARIIDTEYASGTTTNVMYFEWVIGTPTSGATLSNRLGAPTLPNSSYLLADLRVATSDSTILNSMIGEKRQPSGPYIYGEDGKRYRLGVSSAGVFGLDDLTV